MATQLISLKIDDDFLGQIDYIAEKKQYHSRTEFIRHALREKIEEIEYRDAMVKLAKMRGSAKTKTSKKEYEQLRRDVAKELYKEAMKASGVKK